MLKITILTNFWDHEEQISIESNSIGLAMEDIREHINEYANATSFVVTIVPSPA